MGDEQEDRKTIHYYYYIPLIILIVMMFIISLFFFILFIKSKAFNKYECYNLTIFILVMLLDSLLRIIPFSDDDSNINIFEYLQAFLLVFFDKVILAVLTTQTILFYIGVIYTKTFKNNDKKAFFISFVINIVISSSLAILYIYFGGIRLASHRRYLYCKPSKLKEISDPIFNSVYLIANLYCSIFLIR